MEITITGRNVTLSEKLKSKIEEKVGKLKKYNDNIEAAKITVSQQKNDITVEAVLTGKNFTIPVKQKGEKLNNSIKEVIKKLETSLKKEHDKLKSKKAAKKADDTGDVKLESKIKSGKAIKVGDKVIIVKTSELKKPISVEEALIILEENNLTFYPFNDLYTESISILYKKSELEFGLIEM